MADSSAEDQTGADVEMENGEEEVVETIVPEEDGTGEDGQDTGLENIEANVPEKLTFLEYLKSPIIELVINPGEDETVLHAHQGLLLRSAFLKESIEAFSADVTTRRIELNDYDLTATVALVEWLYKKDYFPTMTGHQSIEQDPSLPKDDKTGVGLLRHARVYTLAQKLGLPELAKLAHKKIHCTDSTAQGEIAYAKYVYANTSIEDGTIRKPIAAFWATRSHVLRHQAEDEFKLMCLEFPQFGFDVLSLVLDQQEKRSTRMEASSQASGGGRKRARASQGGRGEL